MSGSVAQIADTVGCHSRLSTDNTCCPCWDGLSITKVINDDDCGCCDDGRVSFDSDDELPVLGMQGGEHTG
jgi:hypothetical protein